MLKEKKNEEKSQPSPLPGKLVLSLSRQGRVMRTELARQVHDETNNQKEKLAPVDPFQIDSNLLKIEVDAYYKMKNGESVPVKFSEHSLALRCIQKKMNDWLKRNAPEGTTPIRLKITGIFDEPTLSALVLLDKRTHFSKIPLSTSVDKTKIAIGPKTIKALEAALVAQPASKSSD